MCDGRERDVPAATPCVPPFVLDYTARLLAHAGGASSLEDAEARALGPVPLATFEVGDEVFVASPDGSPWPLATLVALASASWRMLPCGASVLLAGSTPLRVTDGALEALVDGAEGEGVDPARILAEAEALTGRRLALGPWTRRPDELERSAVVTVLTANDPPGPRG